MNLVGQVLGKIALKTPAIIVEEAMDPVGELEYDAIRREYAHTVRPRSDESSCGSELLSRIGGFEAQENIGEAHTPWALRDSVPEQQRSCVPSNHARPRELQVCSRPSVIVAFVFHEYQFEQGCPAERLYGIYR